MVYHHHHHHTHSVTFIFYFSLTFFIFYIVFLCHRWILMMNLQLVLSCFFSSYRCCSSVSPTSMFDRFFLFDSTTAAAGAAPVFIVRSAPALTCLWHLTRAILFDTAEKMTPVWFILKRRRTIDGMQNFNTVLPTRTGIFVVLNCKILKSFSSFLHCFWTFINYTSLISQKSFPENFAKMNRGQKFCDGNF